MLLIVSALLLLGCLVHNLVVSQHRGQEDILITKQGIAAGKHGETAQHSTRDLPDDGLPLTRHSSTGWSEQQIFKCKSCLERAAAVRQEEL